MDWKVVYKSSTSDAKPISVEVGDRLDFSFSGPLEVQYNRLIFIVTSKYTSSEKKGCKKVETTHYHPRTRNMPIRAELFKHYWPIILVPGAKGPERRELKQQASSIVCEFKGDVVFQKLFVPDSNYLYLPGDAAGSRLSAADWEYLERMKQKREMPASNHDFYCFGPISKPENPAPQPCTNLSITITVRKA